MNTEKTSPCIRYIYHSEDNLKAYVSILDAKFQSVGIGAGDGLIFMDDTYNGLRRKRQF